MSVVTGETGAGKSIFVEALNLLGGARLSSDVVGHKKQETKIEGIFSFKENSHAYSQALVYDLDPSEDCVFTRTINQDGRSTYRINRQIVNLGVVRDILRDEIDIHSQFDNAFLRNEKVHLNLLDKYHTQQDLVLSVKDAHKQIEALEKEKEAFSNNILSDSQKEFLLYQVNEIESLNLDINEEQQLSETLESMSHYEHNHMSLRSARQLLDELDTDKLFTVIDHLKAIKSPQASLVDSLEMIESAYYQLEEGMMALSKTSDDLVFDPQEFEQLQSRQYEYAKIKRKYKMDTVELIDFFETSKQTLNDLENAQEVLHDFDQQILEARAKFDKLAINLTSVREKASQTLKKEIEKQLNDLSLPFAAFGVEFYPSITNKGHENCRFMISLNKGQSLQPLSKVASGGEISRLMLGLKIIFNRLGQIEFVVFDEIDTGLSGPVATQVGLKMHELAKDCKVLTVTHLPAVAACGDEHFVVQKTSDETKTLVTVKRLNMDERLNELALMAFSSTNQAALDAAKLLLVTTEEAKL